MKIETYEVLESTIKGKEAEDNPEALALIESLGLKGQEKLLGKGVQETAVRCPYRIMTTTEYRVYSALLPDRDKLENYSNQSIPLRVLQVAAHAKEIGMFRRFEIWHCEGKDDPLLIGSTSDYDYSRPEQRNTFILARWGSELKSFDELIGEAKKIISSKIKSGIQNILSTLNSVVENPDLKADVYLRTGKFLDAIYFNLD